MPVVSVTLWTVTSDTTREEEGVQLEFLGQSPLSTTHPRSEIIPNLHNHHGNKQQKAQQQHISSVSQLHVY